MSNLEQQPYDKDLDSVHSVRYSHVILVEHTKLFKPTQKKDSLKEGKGASPAIRNDDFEYFYWNRTSTFHGKAIRLYLVKLLVDLNLIVQLKLNPWGVRKEGCVHNGSRSKVTWKTLDVSHVILSN